MANGDFGKALDNLVEIQKGLKAKKLSAERIERIVWQVSIFMVCVIIWPIH